MSLPLIIFFCCFLVPGAACVCYWGYRIFLEKYLHPFFGTLITVTAADIAQGQKGACSRCPVALAITREMQKKYPNNPKASAVVGNLFNAGTCDIKLFFGWGGFSRKTHDPDAWGEDAQKWYAFWGHPDTRRIAKFASDFDRDLPVSPFTFKLMI